MDYVGGVNMSLGTANSSERGDGPSWSVRAKEEGRAVCTTGRLGQPVCGP